MNDKYKLVPVEPTPEMRRKAGLIRGADYYTIAKVWRAMIDAAPDHIADARKMAAPAVQELIASTVQASNQSVSQILKEIECNIEPTVRDVINGQSGINDIYDYLARIKIMLSQLYITQSDQQPAPDLHQIVDGMVVSMDVSTGEHNACHRIFGRIAGVEGEGKDAVILCEMTEDNRDFQPAPDATVLVETLESIAEYWNQDSNEGAMRDACEYAQSAALAALAAYRKQGGDV